MFKLDDKEYDESKLNDKAKFSLAQLQNLGQKKNSLLADLQNADILVNHYTNILKEELPKEEEKKEKNNVS